LEFPASHRLPLAWLFEAGSTPIQYRAYAEVAPETARDPVRLAALRTAVLEYKPALAVARKQKDSGLWADNLLAPGALKAYGWKDAGTVYQYRRLVEFGWPSDHRVLRVADRFLFQLLSRLEPDDPDPDLATRARAFLVEFDRPAKGDPTLAHWARQLGREAAATALARGGHAEDPRLRGLAHRIASDISLYLRSELAQKPFKKFRGKTVLDPAAYPPTVFAVELLAFMPTLRRERAGFVERLGQYLSSPAPKRAFQLVAGKKLLKPVFPILGDPLRADARGRVQDVPFALYWLELLARLGLLRQLPSAAKVFTHFLAECDDHGIWSPRNLRSRPLTKSPLTAHYYPLEGPGKSPAQRQTDVTFRLALIAKLLGLPVEVV
jgi:hypothetical protein